MKMMRRAAPSAATALLFVAATCGPASRRPAGPPPSVPPTPDALAAAVEAPRGEGLPPVPARSGPLAIDVVYPGEGAEIAAVDSNFVFGSVGTGGASLTINGAPVQVAPNGAFLAFVAVPPDGVYRVEASAGGQRAGMQRRVRVPARQEPPALGGPLAIVAGSLAPRGAMTVVEGEPVEVRLRATPGVQARLVLPDGSVVPLVPRPVVERQEGFQQDVATRPRESAEYAGVFAARVPIASTDTGVAAPTLVSTRGARPAYVELARGTETVRTALPLSLGVLRPGEARVGVAATDRPDATVTGTALPGGGTPYHWFFPNGARFTVTGERGGEYRVRLTDGQDVWVDARGVRLDPAGAPPPAGTVGAVRVIPAAEWVDVRLALSDRLPFRVEMHGERMTIDVYGARTRTNWLHYGSEDPFVRRVEWSQERGDLYRVTLELDRPAWGWRSFYDPAGALVVRLRRPPPIDARRPLAGLLIGVDAGHPPGGAIGPTRLTEAEANLAIAKHLVRMLQAAGARVLETRPDTAAVALGARPLAAERANVHLLVSVHNNAFPDGVNPFENNGTTVFYNAPQSLPLARHFQRELLRELGLRDLGVAWADLALARPTWFPSALTETMFLMIPRQEAALRDDRVRERIARAHFRAFEAFLREQVPR